jgi:lipopolysaccharide/colanic/teichoic acid biosynthesis glycosyltransferase
VPQALPWETLNQVITAVAVAPDAPQVHLSAGFYDLLTTRVRLSPSHDVPLLTVGKACLSRQQSVIKATLDYVVAAVLLASLSPAIALMVTWQRLRGDRHLLERRSVAGGGGQIFGVLRFRSSAPFQSALLCKLPGLVNVLRGQLSIVGPHPMDAGDATLSPVMTAGLRPGLTGPWRDVEDPAEQSVRDLYYVRAYSVSLDAQVLFRRVRSRFRRRPRVAAADLVVERAQ